MHDGLLLGVLGLIALAFVFALGFLSRNARLRRRLRKTHSRIVSKSQRPTVKFSVKPPPE